MRDLIAAARRALTNRRRGVDAAADEQQWAEVAHRLGIPMHDYRPARYRGRRRA